MANMGSWKTKQNAKKNTGKSEPTKKAHIYYAYPPVGGWPGGRPEDNGYRRGAK